MKKQVFILMLLSGFAPAKTTRFDMRDGLQRNVVDFVSDAPLEKIVGLSTALWGWVELDPENLAKGVRGELEMDMRTFETGIAARNAQLREKIFLANENPVAKFTIRRLLRTPKRGMLSLQPVTIEAEGELYFRGLTVTEKVPVKLMFMVESDKTRQRLPGNLLRVQAGLTLDLGRYQVEVPEVWHLRFSPKVAVHLDAIGSDQSPAGAAPVIPEGPKPKERAAATPSPSPKASPSPTPSPAPTGAPKISPNP